VRIRLTDERRPQVTDNPVDDRWAGKKARSRAERGPDGAHNLDFSKIIDKGLNILDLFRPEATSLSLKEIAEATGINRTSSFRFVDTLVQLGYPRKDPRLKLIKPGPSPFRSAEGGGSHASLRRDDIMPLSPGWGLGTGHWALDKHGSY